MNHSFSAQDFLLLLEEQSQALEQLIQYGVQQQDAIGNDRVSELVAILAQKQPSLDHLTQLRRQLQDVRDVVESDSFWPNSAIRAQCKAKRERASQLFETLIEFENRCEVSLVASRNQTRERLLSLDTGRVAANAYQTQALATPPSRIDFSSMG